MAYERIAHTDLAELARRASEITDSSPPSRYERIGQTNIAELQRLTDDTVDTETAIGGYERVGSIEVVTIQKKIVTATTVTSYSRTLTVDHSKVPSTQTNFPVLVSITNATLKTVANSGHVQRSDGFDIGFYSDSGLTTKLKWEMESYSSTTGAVVAWVKIASISSSVDTVFYMGYGSTTITTDQSDAVNTWSNGFISVYHLGNGTTLSVVDALAANNGTNHSVTAGTGKVDGAGSFVAASSQYVELGTGINPSEITMSAWVNATSFPNSLNAVLSRDVAGSLTIMFVKSNGKLSCWETVADGGGPNLDGTGAITLSTGTWYYLALKHEASSGDMSMYVNAVNDGTFNGSPQGLKTTAAPAWIGGDLTGTFYWNGLIDEARIASVARSADWITTEYNNQNSPGTFITVGSET